MKPRIQYAKVSPEGITRMRGLEGYVRQCGLDASLLELVKIRAWQINECAYYIDMCTRDARVQGERELRLCALFAWEETPFLHRV